MMTNIEMSFSCGAPIGPLILVEEIGHRVVNEYTQAIACIRLAAGGVASAEARDILASAADRLVNFAEAHRALQPPANAENADLGDYLERLCAAVAAASLNERGVRLSLATEAVELSSDRCWRAALVVSELITNAARHGLRSGPGVIHVELERSGSDVFCRVSDDGHAGHNPSPGRGLTILRSLAAELGGELQVRFCDDGGRAQLTFPFDGQCSSRGMSRAATHNQGDA